LGVFRKDGYRILMEKPGNVYFDETQVKEKDDTKIILRGMSYEDRRWLTLRNIT
jgi:hypothetical protein